MKAIHHKDTKNTKEYEEERIAFPPSYSFVFFVSLW
jgi:hypothetical protein